MAMHASHIIIIILPEGAMTSMWSIKMLANNQHDTLRHALNKSGERSPENCMKLLQVLKLESFKQLAKGVTASESEEEVAQLLMDFRRALDDGQVWAMVDVQATLKGLKGGEVPLMLMMLMMVVVMILILIPGSHPHLDAQGNTAPLVATTCQMGSGQQGRGRSVPRYH